MAFSLYIKEEIDTYFLPKIQQTKQLVQSALNKLKIIPKTSISLNKLLVIGFSIAMTQDFMSTEQTKNLMVRQFKEDHSTINFDSMSDQEFYHFIIQLILTNSKTPTLPLSLQFNQIWIWNENLIAGLVNLNVVMHSPLLPGIFPTNMYNSWLRKILFI